MKISFPLRGNITVTLEGDIKADRMAGITSYSVGNLTVKTFTVNGQRRLYFAETSLVMPSDEGIKII